MMTLMILVGATWTASYLAKRITRPVQLLAAGAREIGAGHLDHRIEPETRDEFGALVEAFNTMAGELAASQRKLEHSRIDLERKNQQLDERRQYIETVLERIATGVVSLGARGTDRDDQRRGAAPPRRRPLGHRFAGRGPVPARGSAAARPAVPAGACRPTGRRRCSRRSRKSRCCATDASSTSRRPRRRLLARRWQRRRRGPGLRRRDAAHPDAARGGVA